MKKRLKMNILLALSVLFSVWMFVLFLRYTITWGVTTASYQNDPERLAKMEQYFGDTYLLQCIGRIVQNAVFTIGFLLMSACLIFLILRKNKVQLSYAIRYSREKRTERRFARRAERQEKKRQRLQEKLERISKGHESES